VEKVSITDHFCYHIIPFAFNKDYIEAKKDLDKQFNDTNKIWERKKFGGGQRIFEHVKHLIYDSDDSKETIGIRYELRDSSRAAIGLPGNAKEKLVLKIKKGSKQNSEIKEYEYKIKKVHLYVFETQIGFIGLEIEYDFKNIQLEDIIEGNYNIKNVVQNIDSIYHRRKVKVSETLDANKTLNLDEPLPMREVIKNVTRDLEVTTFFENESGLPKQALVYNAVCLSDTNLEKSFIETSIYEMRRLFRKSYKPSDYDIKIEGNEETLQLFENCYWGASLEGVVNIYHLTDDKETNTFFTGTYKGAIEKTYLYFYIIALHQRYALLNFSKAASQVKKTNSIGKEDLDIVKTIKDEKIKIAYFNLRCAFKNLSNITHQNKVYYLIRETLKLEDLSAEVNNELFGLAEILENQEEKILKAEQNARKEEQLKIESIKTKAEKDRNIKETQRFNFLTIAVASLAAFFWLPSIVISSWDIIARISKGEIPLSGSMWILLSILSPFLFVTLPTLIVVLKHNNSKKLYAPQKDSNNQVFNKATEYSST
jgi:hypothetical protein